MSKRTSELLVNDMLDSCHKIMVYTQDMSYDDYGKVYNGFRYVRSAE